MDRLVYAVNETNRHWVTVVVDVQMSSIEIYDTMDSGSLESGQVIAQKRNTT